MTTVQFHSIPLNTSSWDEPMASIMIVDDEKALRMVLRHAMEGEGYRVIDAGSGERCLFLCQQELPDIILLDAVMPGIDGFECCRRLLQIFGDRCPPILIITALCDQESVNKAFSVGATDFITKPIHWAVLRQRVQRILKTYRLTTEWQTSLKQESSLKGQLEIAIQRMERLTQLCKSHGIDAD